METITRRPLSLSDFFKLHQLYDSFDSRQTRQFFDLYWLGLQKRSLKWYLAQVPLFLSTFKIFRKLILMIYPYLIFISQVAVDRHQLVAYGFLIIRKKYRHNLFSAELGVAVGDHYQGQGIGKKIVQDLILAAPFEKIGEIFLTTRTDNQKAISLYQSLGFKQLSIIPNETTYQGKKYDMYLMSLIINPHDH